MSGTTLLKNIVSATGLPKDAAQNEFEKLINNSGKDINNLSLDDIREIMAEYLQEVLLQAKNEFSDY